MPVSVQNEKLIQELIQLKKGGCAMLPTPSGFSSQLMISGLSGMMVGHRCVLAHRLYRAQAYVGAFLRRTPEPAAETEADTALGAVSPVAKPPKEAGAEQEDSSGDAADDLHRIGTFAQVKRNFAGQYTC
jgi:hypothetical protein